MKIEIKRMVSPTNIDQERTTTKTSKNQRGNTNMAKAHFIEQ